jgi:O-antigen/teichoic acid export membrane protein
MARLIVFVGANQLGIQALAFFSALVVIRLLPTHEYALYTLATSFLLTATVLADGGVANGVMSEGGKVWSDRQRLATVVAAGIALRRQMAPLAALVCVPLMLWLLLRNGASWPYAMSITAVVLAAFWATLSCSVLEVRYKLTQELRPLQRMLLGSALIRTMLLVALTSWSAIAALALTANALAQTWLVNRLQRGQHSTVPAVIDAQVKQEILRVVRLSLPGVLYFCVSGQLTIWLLSVFGSTEAVAQVGALGRLAAVLTLVSSVISMIVVPRFARLPNNRVLVLRHYIAVLMLVLGIAGTLTMLVGLFPDFSLRILGPKYLSLREEVVLMALSSCLSLVAGTLAGLASSRALLLRPIVGIPFGLAANVVGVLITDVSSTHGVLLMSVGVSAFSAAFSALTGAWLIWCRTSARIGSSDPQLNA